MDFSSRLAGLKVLAWFENIGLGSLPGLNRPRSIYQYSNMAPRLSGQTSKFGVVLFASKYALGIERQKKHKNLQF